MVECISKSPIDPNKPKAVGDRITIILPEMLWETGKIVEDWGHDRFLIRLDSTGKNMTRTLRSSDMVYEGEEVDLW